MPEQLERLWSELTRQSVFRARAPALLDVRSEGEFAEDPFPHSVNAPFLNNQERHDVGLCYKQKGREPAIELGLSLVAGDIFESRKREWMNAIEKGCQFLTCWRGGLRSKFVQQWLKEAGREIARVEGGTKALRQKCLSVLDSIELSEIAFMLHSRTGAGKTALLKNLAASPKLGFLDLEAAANHRGSAFGKKINSPQPPQATFENQIALELEFLRGQKKRLVIEGESKSIGKSVIPLKLLDLMKQAPVIYLEAPLSLRVENFVREYIDEPLRQHGPELLAKFHQQALLDIQKKLGGDRYRELHNLQEEAFNSGLLSAHQSWVEKLFVYYYDPQYDHAHERIKDRIVFSGDRKAVSEYFEAK